MFSRRFREAELQSVQTTIDAHDLTVLVFLDKRRHHEVEEFCYDLRDRWQEVGFALVHPDDRDAEVLSRQYDVKGTICPQSSRYSSSSTTKHIPIFSALPSALFITHRKKTANARRSVAVVKTLRRDQVNAAQVELFLYALKSPIEHVSQVETQTV